MRQVGTLGELDAARRFAGALRGIGIKAEFRSAPDGRVAVWVLEEDRLEDARRELAAFEADPTGARFDVAPEPVVEDDTSEPEAAERGPGGVSVWRRLPVTLALIVASCVVFAAIEGGADENQATESLGIAPFQTNDQGLVSWQPGEGLSKLRSGELWRAVTPIFLHWGPLHLLCNMAWLWLLGGVIESLRGSVRLAVLVVVIAVASNLAEYFFNFGFDFSSAEGFRADFGRVPNPRFGGMSGVVFGLFGYVWIQARLRPGSGFAMPRDSVVWMMIWLLACMAGFVGPIANVAHGVGLLVGMAAGAVSGRGLVRRG